MIILSVSGGSGTQKLQPMMFEPVETILYARMRQVPKCVGGRERGGRGKGSQDGQP